MEPSIILGQSYVLATGEEAHEGDLGCVDSATGEAVAGQVATGLVLLGTFDLTRDGKVTGDGTLKVRIKFWQYGQVAPCTVTGGDVVPGQTVYVAGPTSVTSTATGASVAGIVVKVDGAIAYVKPSVIG